MHIVITAARAPAVTQAPPGQFQAKASFGAGRSRSRAIAKNRIMTPRGPEREPI